MSRDVTIDTDAYRASYDAKRAREAMNVAYVRRLHLVASLGAASNQRECRIPALRITNALGAMIGGRYVIPGRLSLIAGHVLVQQEFLRGMFGPDTHETFVGLWGAW